APTVSLHKGGGRLRIEEGVCGRSFGCRLEAVSCRSAVEKFQRCFGSVGADKFFRILGGEERNDVIGDPARVQRSPHLRRDARNIRAGTVHGVPPSSRASAPRAAPRARPKLETYPGVKPSHSSAVAGLMKSNDGLGTPGGANVGPRRLLHAVSRTFSGQHFF